MKINGLPLPEAFVQGVRRKQFRREAGFGHLREECDAYGNHLETEAGDIYESVAEIQEATDLLPTHFPRDDETAEWVTQKYGAEPGFMSYITDFSKIVCFGMDGGGACFCFDFRDNKREPSIIWWEDVYWRRIAPDFDAFERLFRKTATGERVVSVASWQGWAFIPGPLRVMDVHKTMLWVCDQTLYPPQEISQAFLTQPGFRLVHEPDPSWQEWKARWQQRKRYFVVGMALLDDEPACWGGSDITEANCKLQDLLDVWLRLRKAHRGVWLQHYDQVYTPKAFQRDFGLARGRG